MKTLSPLDPARAAYRHIIPAGDPWTHKIKRGQTLRIVDVAGNQAADTLFYDAHQPENRYSASDTIRRQAKLYLETGTDLVSTFGDVLLTIVADTCGRHDTLGGACSRESNTMRYALDKESMHACRDSFICGVHTWRPDLGKRDITCNINFFMNVPVTPDGRLTFADGVSAPGHYVELRAARDVVCVISNCPQLNNPCNAYNPTPVEVLLWDESRRRNEGGEGMNQETVGKAVLDAAFKVHTSLGPGLLESVYEAALTRELVKRGHRVERQKPIPVFYDDELMDEVGFRADLIVDGLVLVELKSVSEVTDVFKKITQSYLRFIPLQLGFLINFNEAHLKNGITRIVNGAEGKPFFSGPSLPSPLRETP